MESVPRFSPEVNARIFEAHKLAASRGETHSDVAHILVAMLRARGGQAASQLDRAGYDLTELAKLAELALAPPPKASNHATHRWSGDEPVQVTSGFMSLLGRASEIAATSGDREVDELHLLRALASHDDPAISSPLRGVEISPTGGIEQKASTAIAHLSHYGRILTDEARNGFLDPVIGRTRQLQRMVHILGRRRKNNPVLLGNPGVGKTALVEGLAQAIVEDRVPTYLTGREIFALDIGSLVAGTKYRGEFESRIQELLEAIRSTHGGIIMFVDELHLIARAGGAEGAIDAAGFLKPLLARGELRVIGATTLADYRRQIVGDGALERRFQPILVEEPTPSEALEMLEGLRPRYEAHHGVSISDSALKVAIEASHLRIPRRNLPDKAIDLIDEASSYVRAREESAEVKGPLKVTAPDVMAVLEAWIGDLGEDWDGLIYGTEKSESAHG